VTLLDCLAIVLGCCVGGFVSGVAGFAFGMVAMVSWVWRIDPQIIAPMVVFGSIVTQSTSVTCLHCGVNWRLTTQFLVGGLAGVPLGIMLLGCIDVVVFKGAMGVVIILFSLALLFVSDNLAVRWGGGAANGCAGFVGGVMGGLCGLNGPAPIVWCLVRGWDKDTQRGLTQVYFLSTQVVTMIGYALSGKITRQVLIAFAIMLPCVLLAAYVGNRVYDRIDTRQFRRIVLALLLISGAVLLVSSLAAHRF